MIVTYYLPVPGFWSRMTSWWQLHTWPSATWLPNKELAAFPPFPSLHLNLRNFHLIKDLAPKVARATQRQSCLPVIPVKARLTWAAPVLLSTFHFNLGYFTLQQRTVLSIPHAWRQHICSEATPLSEQKPITCFFPAWSVSSRERGRREVLSHGFLPRQLKSPN